MSLVPANWTSETVGLRDSSQIVIYFEETLVGSAISLSTAANASNVLSDGWQGTYYLAYPSSYEDTTGNDIAFVQCDPVAGEISTQTIFNNVSDLDPVAIVVYSTHSDYCRWTTSPWQNPLPVFSLITPTEEGQITEPAWSGSTPCTITTRDKGAPAHASPPGQPGSETHSTALAMIILYSITGVIALLFLGIIITGAVRAHRYPERYGPRTVLGRGGRRSRARGLAQAMLDTLPIVKFGEREDEQQPKTDDIELNGESRAASVVKTAEMHVREQSSPSASVEAQHASNRPADPTADTHPTTQQDNGREGEAEMGIAAATTEVITVAPNASNPNHEECAICAEEFERGQDQRVLPCDHRFHPACIDPWLLNVSGTCPMCRINLAQNDEGVDGEADNSADRTVDPMSVVDRRASGEPIPLLNYRRALVSSILGSRGRPDMYTREERLAAIQELNRHAADVRRRQHEAAVAAAAVLASMAERQASVSSEQPPTRGRLRSLLVRRGQRGSVVSTLSEAPPNPSETQGEASTAEPSTTEQTDVVPAADSEHQAS